MSDASLVSLLLTNRVVDVGVKPMTAREFWELFRRVPELGRLLGADSADVASTVDVDPVETDRIVRLLEAATAFAFERVRLEDSGIKVVSVFDADYPARLRQTLHDKAPVFLLVAGSGDIVHGSNRGIVGSRDASPEAIEVAHDAARAAVRRGDNVVSGCARGIDRSAMGAAVEVGGRIVGVPSEGVRVALKTADVRRLVHDESLCLVSPYGPDSPFSVGAAMGRNKFVYALSLSTLVVSTDLEKGGTWEGAKETLDHRFGAVDVWLGAGAGTGNQALATLGARSVRSADEFWSVDFETPEPPLVQETLF